MRLPIFLLLLFPSLAWAGDNISATFGVARTHVFGLRDEADVKRFINSVDFTAGDCAASACCTVIIDGTATTCDNQPVAVSGSDQYAITASAAELGGGCQIVYELNDAAGTPRFADKTISFYTTGSDSGCFGMPQVNVKEIEDNDATNVIDGRLAAYDALVPADLPPNFGLLGINPSGHVARVVLVDTTTANTDMRGTDSAATAAALATVNSNVDAILDDTGTTGVKVATNGIDDGAITTATANKIADVTLRRTAANVFASIHGDALDCQSLYGMIAQSMVKVVASAGTWTVFNPNDSILCARTTTADVNAAPIISVD